MWDLSTVPGKVSAPIHISCKLLVLFSVNNADSLNKEIADPMVTMKMRLVVLVVDDDVDCEYERASILFSKRMRRSSSIADVRSIANKYAHVLSEDAPLWTSRRPIFS